MSLQDRYEAKLKAKRAKQAQLLAEKEETKAVIKPEQVIEQPIMQQPVIDPSTIDEPVHEYYIDSGAHPDLEHRDWRCYSGVLRNFNVRLHAYHIWIGNPIFQQPFNPGRKGA